MTETYLQKLQKERKARLSRIAKASVELNNSSPAKPLQIITEIDTKSEESPEDQILNRKPIDFKDIFKAVCRHYGVSMLDIISARRHGKIVLARHVIAFIADQHTPLSIGMIASRLARDKSTIEYALERMEILSKTDAISADIVAIKKALGL